MENGSRVMRTSVRLPVEYFEHMLKGDNKNFNEEILECIPRIVNKDKIKGLLLILI